MIHNYQGSPGALASILAGYTVRRGLHGYVIKSKKSEVIIFFSQF